MFFFCFFCEFFAFFFATDFVVNFLADVYAFFLYFLAICLADFLADFLAICLTFFLSFLSLKQHFQQQSTLQAGPPRLASHYHAVRPQSAFCNCAGELKWFLLGKHTCETHMCTTPLHAGAHKVHLPLACGLRQQYTPLQVSCSCARLYHWHMRAWCMWANVGQTQAWPSSKLCTDTRTHNPSSRPAQMLPCKSCGHSPTSIVW